MEAERLQLKIFVDSESGGVERESFIPVFHRWIKEHVLPELLVDVANYLHVPRGPGIVLIGHASDYFMDEGDGRLGLLHNRKRAAPAPDDRLADLVRRTLHAAHLLEQEPALAGKLRFSTHELLFRVNDRLAAPANDATFDALRPELEGLGRKLFDAPFELTRKGGDKDLFAVRFTSRSAPSLAALLERAGGPPGP